MKLHPQSLKLPPCPSMADGGSCHPTPKSLAAEAVPSPIHPDLTGHGKFYSQFLHRVIAIAFLFVILPLLPLEAPEFVNRTIPTRGWELLHLLFVGIAVSYGLFSRRADEPEKEIHPKFDSAQSFVSRLLQVSSVFDDEAEAPCGSDDLKVEAWSSQCYREDPLVGVGRNSSFIDESKGASYGICDKRPLLLPVRSLKTARVSNADALEPVARPSCTPASPGRSTMNLSKASARFINEHLGDDSVLRSPIPWRSRSGRIGMKEDLEEIESVQCDESGSSGPHVSTGPSSSPKKQTDPSPSPSFSLLKAQANSVEDISRKHVVYRLSSPPPSPSRSPLDSQAKNVEDFSRKHAVYRMSSPPPASSPPKPTVTKKPLSMDMNSKCSGDETFSEKEYRRCLSDEPKDFRRGGREEFLHRANSGKEAKPRAHMGKSVRTYRAAPVDLEGDTKLEKARSKVEGSSEAWNSPEKQNQATLGNRLKPTVSGLHDQFNSGSDISDFQERHVLASCKKLEKRDEGNEMTSCNVDRKADEFIAKFREQIRLQRIDSSKKSSKQLNKSLRGKH